MTNPADVVGRCDNEFLVMRLEAYAEPYASIDPILVRAAMLEAADLIERLERSNAELVGALKVAIHRLEAHEEPAENDDIRAALIAAEKVGK